MRTRGFKELLSSDIQLQKTELGPTLYSMDGMLLRHRPQEMLKWRMAATGPGYFISMHKIPSLSLDRDVSSAGRCVRTPSEAPEKGAEHCPPCPGEETVMSGPRTGPCGWLLTIWT